MHSLQPSPQPTSLLLPRNPATCREVILRVPRWARRRASRAALLEDPLGEPDLLLVHEDVGRLERGLVVQVHAALDQQARVELDDAVRVCRRGRG